MKTIQASCSDSRLGQEGGSARDSSTDTGEQTPTKRSILSQLSSIYDPLGIISPTMVEGKRIYREACDEKIGWNTEVNSVNARDWLKWSSQLRNIYQSAQECSQRHQQDKGCTTPCFRGCQQHSVFSGGHCCSGALNRFCEGAADVKVRISKRNTSISRLELVGGQMAANMVKNLLTALKRWPITSVNVWMDSMVALFWICNPGRAWKTFVSNRVRKIAEITQETGIDWRYCPTDRNLADLGSRGASIEKMQRGQWFEGPEWLLKEEEWPEQPELEKTKSVSEEHRPEREETLYTAKKERDEWDTLLDRSKLWRTFRVTAWALRFKHNSLTKKHKTKKRTGPLTTEELSYARDQWIRKEQAGVQPDSPSKSPGWKLIREACFSLNTGIFKCKGRIPGYQPTYIEGGVFADKLIRHIHEDIKHLGVASTMAAVREEWWIPQLRSKVKKMVNNCYLCKVFSTRPYGPTETAALPPFRTECGRPFETTGIDFAGPLSYKISKKEQGKCHILIFTCATSRAVHLEVTKSQTAEEFQRKLNGFITRRTRPKRIVSDNAAVFKTTATWIRKIRKSEELQDFLAQQQITWQFNLSRSPWWGGLYERLIKEVKKTLYKTMGRTHLEYAQVEAVVMDIERHLNNRPLTYMESETGEEQVLTPNAIMWGQEAYTIEDIELDGDEVTKLQVRLNEKRQHVWQRWKKEYVHGLMESHRIKRGESDYPEIGEIVLIIGDEKNRGEWKKGRVLRHIRGRDGVVRGVGLLHKGNQIQRPLHLICPLEIRSRLGHEGNTEELAEMRVQGRTIERRRAAVDAGAKIRLIRLIAADD